MKILSFLSISFISTVMLFFSMSTSADGGGGSYVTSLPDSISSLVENEQFAEAVPELKKFVRQERNNADAWNLLGYSQRKIGMLDKSLRSYRKALSLDPQHLGAHEYLGELYLMMNKPEKAKKQLKKLRRYCGDCEQAEELSEAIEKYVG